MTHFPTVSNDPGVQAHYARCRQQGTSHALAEMFALGQPPMSNTDREFLEGRGGCYDQFPGQHGIGEMYRRKAEAAGVSPQGKVYVSGLARFPGDPEAWVSGRGDAQRLCEQRGWACEGSVKVKLRQPEAAPCKGGLASDLVDDLVEKRLADVPLGERVSVQDVRESVVAAHAPHWAPREIVPALTTQGA